MEKRRSQNRNSALQAVAVTTVIGMEMAITVVLGFYAGRFADSRLGTEPWLLVTGVLLGVAAGTMGIVKTLQRFFWSEKG